MARNTRTNPCITHCSRTISKSANTFFPTTEYSITLPKSVSTRVSGDIALTNNDCTADNEYVATRPGVTYCQYIAETAHDSPAKTLRMKTILFLQGSPFYDVVEAEERLQGIDKLFYEKAIVYGRVRAGFSLPVVSDGKLILFCFISSDGTKRRCSYWLSICAIQSQRKRTALKVE
jgi:hypothetical protein